MRTIGLNGAIIWLSAGAVVLIPIIAAATSPLLAWRDAVYIAASFAGILAMSLLFVQPLLATGALPGLNVRRGRQVHRIVGGLLVAGVMVHVAGLFVTSPPDVIDVLLFRSPTPFSVWGMVAFIGVLLSTSLALLRRKLRFKPLTWRFAHLALSAVIVAGTVIHAWLIQGTMETISKSALSVFVLASTFVVLKGQIAPRR